MRLTYSSLSGKLNADLRRSTESRSFQKVAPTTPLQFPQSPNSKNNMIQTSKQDEMAKRKEAEKKKLKSKARILGMRKKSAYAKLTPKQRGFVNDRHIDGESVLASVVNNYDSANEQSAYALATALNKNPKIIAAVDEIYDRAGVTADRLAQVTNEALSATVVVKNLKDGEATETEVPDHDVRLKAVNVAHKARGDYVSKVEQKSVHVHGTVAEVAQLDAEFREFLEQKHKKKQMTGEIPSSVLD